MAFPDERDRALIKQAERIVNLSSDLGDWLADHGPQRQERHLGEISPDEEAKLLGLRREAHNLRSSARVPVAAAVYGPSQVGKSLFVGRVLQPRDRDHSPLGRDERLGPPAYMPRLDFIQDLNPQLGEREATALVTRFTTKDRIDTPAGSPYPVAVRALTRAEWLRLLARGFKAECRRRDEGLTWTQAALREVFERVRKTSASPQGDPRWRTDLYEAYAYMRRHYPRDFPATEIEFNGFLSLYRLTDQGYEGVASALFWDEWPELDELFAEVAGLLRTIHETGKGGLLSHWAGVRFLLDSQLAKVHENPSSTCFDRVDWADFALEFDPRSGWWVLDHRPGTGACNVEAYRLQAAMLELVIPVLPDRLTEGWRQVLAEIDLLDIPGMRAEKVAESGKRTSADRVEERMEIVKRGKVLYLFERYIEELQVQTLLLLTRHGNLEVKDQMKHYVNLWGRARYGKGWPRNAEGDPPALFMGMTGIDAEFRNQRGQSEETYRQFYENRINTLRDALGTAVMDDFGGRRFTNIYPIRYPGTWDTTSEERAGDTERRWEAAERAFLGSALVRGYVRAPEEKWRAAMDDRDGGVALIGAGFLACTGAVGKQDHLRDRIDAAGRHLLQMATGWAVAEDANVDRDQRVAVAKEVLDWLGRDEHAIYYRLQALRESLCVQEADIWELADSAEAPSEPGYLALVPLPRRLPGLLREFLRGWAAVGAPRRWEASMASHRQGAPWLGTDVFHALASYLVEYLSSPSVFDSLSARLLDVLMLRLNDEAACRHARRKYTQLILNDYLLNPGPVPSAPEAVDGGVFGLMDPFYRSWCGRLPEALAAGAGEEVKVPPGNAALNDLLARYEGP